MILGHLDQAGALARPGGYLAHGSAREPTDGCQSLRRRSERLQKRLRELELLQRGAAAEAIAAATPVAR
jgi:hypothetical protein